MIRSHKGFWTYSVPSSEYLQQDTNMTGDNPVQYRFLKRWHLSVVEVYPDGKISLWKGVYQLKTDGNEGDHVIKSDMLKVI